jgi:hypothetical protein
MSATLLQRQSLSIPLGCKAYSVCILHRGRWHVTPVSKPFEVVVEVAEDAFRRAGLPVQIRDEDETVLFEANETSTPRQTPVVEPCKETRSW